MARSDASKMSLISAVEGNVEFVQRRDGDDLKIVRKKVSLANTDKAIFTLSFLV